MRMGQGVRTDLGHGGMTCVLQIQFSSCTVGYGVCVINSSNSFSNFADILLTY